MKQVTLQLTPEELKITEDTLRDSLSYATSIDACDHPEDIIAWGKILQTVGSVLLKIKSQQGGKK